jgi:hypothetical protein
LEYSSAEQSGVMRDEGAGYNYPSVGTSVLAMWLTTNF